ncbi:SAM-dependent methyltransferase [Algoriphagus machipongonensis]|nr:class I SAM-dependent methyltransferase [Algoriphagus machipongonensis]
MIEIKNSLRRIFHSYAKETLDYHDLKEATEIFKTSLFNWHSKNFLENLDRENLIAENGIAIGPYWAAMCLDDLMRTRQFIRGITKAFDEKLKKQSSIEVIYAGTGPFANLLLPIFQEYKTHQIRYTLVEINPISFSILQGFMEEFNQEDLDITLVMADASKLKLDPKRKPDIIISETMQAGLKSEPQIAISQNLLNQADEDSILIPQNIKLSLGLSTNRSSNKEYKIEEFYKTSLVMEVNKSTLKKYPNGFPEVQTKFLQKDLNINSHLSLLTEIQIFEEEALKINQSGLTNPLNVAALSQQDIIADYIIHTKYQLGQNPELIIKIM